MRGKVMVTFLPIWIDGITPAYAGKRFLLSVSFLLLTDPPRLCGEKAKLLICHITQRGSPPPMRGKGFYRGFRSFSDGITPAYAGKRYLCFGRGSAGWDHPRLCGEKCSRYSMDASYSGSPPPMRGKVKIPVVVGYKNRITPAYAGKSPEIATVMVQPQDHPRLCGEKFRNFRL